MMLAAAWDGGRRLLPIIRVKIDLQGVAKVDKPVN